MVLEGCLVFKERLKVLIQIEGCARTLQHSRVAVAGHCGNGLCWMSGWDWKLAGLLHHFTVSVCVCVFSPYTTRAQVQVRVQSKLPHTSPGTGRYRLLVSEHALHSLSLSVCLCVCAISLILMSSLPPFLLAPR